MSYSVLIEHRDGIQFAGDEMTDIQEAMRFAERYRNMAVSVILLDTVATSVTPLQGSLIGFEEILNQVFPGWKLAEPNQ